MGQIPPNFTFLQKRQKIAWYCRRTLRNILNFGAKLTFLPDNRVFAPKIYKKSIFPQIAPIFFLKFRI